MKKNKPPVSRLFVYIFEVVVSVSAFVAFFVLTANGIAVGKWTFALISVHGGFTVGLKSGLNPKSTRNGSVL